MHKGFAGLSAALLATAMAAPLTAQSLGEQDANDDGVIDRAEFRQGLGDDWFDRWDRDGDAILSETELGEGLFQLWDRDGDGSLIIEEWDTAADLWFGEAAVNLSVSEWDANGDGSISREEFMSAGRKRTCSRALRPTMRTSCWERTSSRTRAFRSRQRRN